MRLRRTAVGAWFSAVLWLGCQSLTPIDLGVCGNQVLDPGEDCDTRGDASLGQGTACAAPSNEHACRYVCDASACPTGWDCGDDGICRRSSGTFVAGKTTGGWVPSNFDTADFDGDGVPDVIGRFADRLEIRSGSSDGVFHLGPVLPLQAGDQLAPVPGDVVAANLDDDPYGDILVPHERGFVVWRGQSTGPPLKAAYGLVEPSLADYRAVPMHFGPGYPAGLLGLLIQAEEGVSAAAFSYAQAGPLQLPFTLCPGKDLGTLQDRLPTGAFTSPTRDELVVAFPGASEITLFYGKHDPTNGKDSFTSRSVAIDVAQDYAGSPNVIDGLAIGKGALTADVDHDGHADILVNVVHPVLPFGGVLVLRGMTGGEFAAPHLVSAFNALASAAGDAWPLAVGDFDEDGIVDYVNGSGVFVSDGSAALNLTKFPFATARPWTDVAVGDIDGDGHADIVGTKQGEASIDVFRRQIDAVGIAFAAHNPYELQHGVKAIRVGNLQGLATKDIVFAESDASGTDDDAIGVLYGNLGGWPSPPVVHVRFHEIEHFEVARTQVIGGSSSDLLEDVEVISRTADRRLVYSQLDADGARQLDSALALPEIAGRFDFGTGKVALRGRFVKGPVRGLDLFLLGQSPDRPAYAWWLPRKEDAAYDIPGSGYPIAQDVPDFDMDCARFASGDIDGDGFDEVVGIAGAAICPEASKTRLVIARVLGNPRIPSEKGKIAFQSWEVALASQTGDARVALVDLDGDGARDLLVAGKGSLAVFRGSTGGLSLEPIFSELPQDESVRDIASIARSKDASGVGAVAVLTDASVITLASGFPLRPTRVASAGAAQLRSADVNGDGLGDIVLSGPSGIQVLFAVPASPLGGS